MPRYFIDLEIDDERIRDADGADYRDAAAAGREAVGVLDDLSRGRIRDGVQHHIAGFVRDDSGELVFKARLSLMIEVV